jgi:hypothetical protein
MLAKSIFRSASTRLSARQPVNKIAQMLTCQRALVSLSSCRMFSTAAIEKSVQKLSKALEKELKYENENYAQLEDIDTFLKESGF